MGRVNSFVLQNCGQIFYTQGIHHEDMKLHVPRIFGEETIREMIESIPGSVSQVIFDLDDGSVSG
jgi:hypothetical protein